MHAGFWLKGALLACGLALAGGVQANISTVPDVTYEALGLDR
ncbi:MAG: hypothetical protein RI993_1340, partial [Pseudomonadota bacterium]